MFRTWRFIALLTITGAILAACAGNSPIDVGPGDDDDDGSTPAAPTLALYTTNVQPFFVAQSCGVGGCHLTPGVGTPDPYVLVTAAPNAADTQANYDETVCDPRLTAWGGSPAGKILSYFCVDATTPTAGHNGKVATAADCTALYNWASSGSGTPPACN